MSHPIAIKAINMALNSKNFIVADWNDEVAESLKDEGGVPTDDPEGVLFVGNRDGKRWSVLLYHP